MPCTLNFSITNFEQKYWIVSKDWFSQMVTIHFTLQTLQHQMPHYPVSKQFCLTLCTVEWGLVSGWVTRANPKFFINEILNFGIFLFSYLFILWIANNLAFFCSFCKVFTLYSSRKNVWELIVIQISTDPHMSVQVFCAPKCLFCGFVLFWTTKWVSLNFGSNKNSQFLSTVFICKLNI